MLEFFRRGVKSWVAQVLLGLLIISFAVWGIGDIFTGARSVTVAEVGETEVESEQLAELLLRQQSLASQRAGQLVSLADLRAAGVDQQIMTALLREASYAEELSKMGIAVPAAAIRDTIASNENFQDESGNFNQLRYQGVLAQQGYSPLNFERLTGRLLGEQILADAVTTGIDAPREIAEAIAVFDGEERTVSLVRLPISEAEDPGQPEESVLTAWFAENQSQFREPVRRWGSFIHVDPVAMVADLAPAEDEVRAAYDASIDTYTRDATRTVEQIVFEDAVAAQDAVDRLTAGEISFLEVAAEQNLGPADIALGTVTPDDLADDTAAAAFALTEPGIAGPIEGLFGSVVLNVTAVQMAGTQPFEEVRDAISSRLAADRARTAVTQKVNELDDVRAGGADLPELAERTGLPLTEFAGLAGDGTVAEGVPPAVAVDPGFIGEVFGADEGEERDIVQLSDDSYVLVMIERVRESYVPELGEVRDAAVAAWQTSVRIDAQERRALELATTEADIAAVAAALGTTVSPLAPFARSGTPGNLSPELVEAIFTADPGTLVVGQNRDATEAIVAEVTEIATVEAADLAVQADELVDILSTGTARDHLEYYARALQARHGASVNAAGIETVFERLSQTGGGIGQGGM